MTNLYIIACFSGHVSGTDVDSNRPGKRRIRKILYGADCAAIWNNLWQKIPDQVFSATVSPEGGFKLCKYSLPAKPGMNNRCASAPGIDGEGRWSHQIQMNPNFGQRAKISQQLSSSLLNWFKP